MVFLTNLGAGRLHFTYGLFGVQYDELTSSKKTLISRLYAMLKQTANRIEPLQSQGNSLLEKPKNSIIFVAYWIHSAEYETWNNTEPVKQFWSGLADDAGVWREVMKVPKSRFTGQSNQERPKMLSTLLGLVESDDQGYWGINRHRLASNPDEFTTPDDTFTSDLETSGRLKPDASKKIIEIPTSFPDKIRLGRLKLTKVPNNLFFFRETQSQPSLSEDEQTFWNEGLRPLFKSWVQHLDKDRNRQGVLSIASLVGHEIHSSNFPPEPFDPNIDLSQPNYSNGVVPETNQLGYYLDLAHFELSGRSFKNHVSLVKDIFSQYGPEGQFGANGKLHIMSEFSILKSGDLDAEYIGCREGTGLMWLQDLDL